jgi:hypothetical protein
MFAAYGELFDAALATRSGRAATVKREWRPEETERPGVMR